jgi:hypothetical protein
MQKSEKRMPKGIVPLLGLLLLVAAGVAPANAADGVSAKDPRGDGHKALDIVRVDVSHTQRLVKVVVTVRDFAHMDSAARVGTAVGVHFDTRGDRKPNHLIKVDGMHVAAGSTRDWNKLRSNGFDPWGDWSACFPSGWTKPLIKARPTRDQLVFNAPRSCLGRPGSVRVAVQSYKPYRSGVQADWVKGPRRYLPRVQLGS